MKTELTAVAQYRKIICSITLLLVALLMNGVQAQVPNETIPGTSLCGKNIRNESSSTGACMQAYGNGPKAVRYPASDVRDADGTVVKGHVDGRKIKNSLTGLWKKWGPTGRPLLLRELQFDTAAKQEEDYYYDAPPTTGDLPSDVQQYIMFQKAAMELATQLTSVDHVAPAAAAQQEAAATSAGNAAAEVARDQAASAIGYNAQYINNFTATPNIWTTIRDQIFVPMAILLLLPGAVLAQARAIVSAGSPVLGEVNPFEGILRSIVAIFMIPATALVVNYGIDLSNSITYTIGSEYERLFHSNMYRDATGAEIRANPVRAPQSNVNEYDVPTAPMGSQHYTNARGSFTQLERDQIATSFTDPTIPANIAPAAFTDEAIPAGAVASRLMMNGSNAGLASAWNVLCAFQLAYLYYLWLVGPIMAALWVYPLRTLRNALPSWIEGVVTLCFWSLFWNTVILLIACFKGVDETGTYITTALNFLATASVKYAFDFAGLVKAAGMEAAGMAMGGAQQAAQSAGAGGGAAHRQSAGAGGKGGSSSGRATSHGATGMQAGARGHGNGNGHGRGPGAGAHGGERVAGALLGGREDSGFHAKGSGTGDEHGRGVHGKDPFHQAGIFQLAGLRQGEGEKGGAFVHASLPPTAGHAGLSNADLLHQAHIGGVGQHGEHGQLHLDRHGNLVDAHGHTLTGFSLDHNGNLVDAHGHSLTGFALDRDGNLMLGADGQSPLMFSNGMLVDANGNVAGAADNVNLAFWDNSTGQFVGAGSLLSDGMGTFAVDGVDGLPGLSALSNMTIATSDDLSGFDDGTGKFNDLTASTFLGDDIDYGSAAMLDANGNVIAAGFDGGTTGNNFADGPPPLSSQQALESAREAAQHNLALLHALHGEAGQLSPDRLAMLHAAAGDPAALKHLADQLGTSPAALAALAYLTSHESSTMGGPGAGITGGAGVTAADALLNRAIQDPQAKAMDIGGGGNSNLLAGIIDGNNTCLTAQDLAVLSAMNPDTITNATNALNALNAADPNSPVLTAGMTPGQLPTIIQDGDPISNNGNGIVPLANITLPNGSDVISSPASVGSGAGIGLPQELVSFNPSGINPAPQDTLTLRGALPGMPDGGVNSAVTLPNAASEIFSTTNGAATGVGAPVVDGSTGQILTVTSSMGATTGTNTDMVTQTGNVPIFGDKSLAAGIIDQSPVVTPTVFGSNGASDTSTLVTTGGSGGVTADTIIGSTGAAIPPTSITMDTSAVQAPMPAFSSGSSSSDVAVGAATGALVASISQVATGEVSPAVTMPGNARAEIFGAPGAATTQAVEGAANIGVRGVSGTEVVSAPGSVPVIAQAPPGVGQGGITNIDFSPGGALSTPAGTTQIVEGWGTGVPTGGSPVILDGGAANGGGAVTTVGGGGTTTTTGDNVITAFGGSTTSEFSGKANFANVTLAPESVPGGGVVFAPVNEGTNVSNVNTGGIQIDNAGNIVWTTPSQPDSGNTIFGAGSPSQGGQEAQAWTSIVSVGSAAGSDGVVIATGTGGQPAGDMIYTISPSGTVQETYPVQGASPASGEVIYYQPSGSGGATEVTYYQPSGGTLTPPPLETIVANANEARVAITSGTANIIFCEEPTASGRPNYAVTGYTTEGSPVYSQAPPPVTYVSAPDNNGVPSIITTHPGGAPEVVPTQTRSASTDIVYGSDQYGVGLGIGMPCIPKQVVQEGSGTSVPHNGARRVTAEAQTPQVSAVRPENRFNANMPTRPNTPPISSGTPTIVQTAPVPQPPSSSTGGGPRGQYSPPTEPRTVTNYDAPPPASMQGTLQEQVQFGQKNGGRRPKEDEEEQAYLKAQLDQMTGNNR